MGGALSVGAVFGWSSPAELPMRERQEYGFPVTVEDWSWVGSTVTFGAAIACAFIGGVINRYGRKGTMLAMAAPFMLGWMLVIWAQNVAMLLIGRLLLGIAGGAYFVMAPIYIGEIAQKEVRGSLASLFQVMETLGILFVYVVGYGLSVFTFTWICAVLPVVFVAVFAFMPESPLYLVSRGRSDAAVRSLRWLRGPQYDCSTELAELEAMREMAAQRAQDENKRAQLWTALCRKSTIRSLYISMGLMFILQFGGIGIVLFYTASIFQSANTGIAPELATIYVGIMQVVGTIIASLIVDRVGRRVLLLVSVSVMAACKALLGVYFVLQTTSTVVGADGGESVLMVSVLPGWLPVFALCVYMVVYSLGVGPIPWLMVGELFAPDVKGVAGSVAGSFSWIMAFAVTKSFASVQASIGTGPTFLMLAGFSAVGTVFVWFTVPETRGKSLLEIQIMLEEGSKKAPASEKVV